MRFVERDGLIEKIPMSPVSVVVLSMLSKGPGEASIVWVSFSLREGGQTPPRSGKVASSSAKPMLLPPRLEGRLGGTPGSITGLQTWVVGNWRRTRAQRGMDSPKPAKKPTVGLGIGELEINLTGP
jgi:hypothetical protein